MLCNICSDPISVKQGFHLFLFRACNFQQAYTNIMTAENYKPKGLFIEKAKLLWAKVEPEGALNTLKRGIEHHFPEAATFKSMPQDTRREDRGLCAEVVRCLLYTSRCV